MTMGRNDRIPDHQSGTLGTRSFSRVVRPKTRAAKKVGHRADHNRDITDTGNRARKTSGTQGINLTN